MKKFILLALSQLFAVSVFADGVPRYYELVTSADQLESGKYYVIVAIPYLDDVDKTKWNDLTGLDNSTPTERIAYNGIDLVNYKGKIGKVFPFSYIIDTQKIWNETNTAVVPLKMTINETASSTYNANVWNIEDESVTAGSRLIGVRSKESGSELKHDLVGSNENNSKNIDLNLWYIGFDTDRAFIRNVGNDFYIKYYANNNDYHDAASFFRAYALNEQRNLLLYKEMVTITAETYFTGHGTLYYSNKVLMVPADVEAMTMTYDAKKKEVNCSTPYVTGSFIPAGSAVVLHNTRDESTFPAIGSADTYTFPVTTRHAPELDKANILSGLLDEDGYTTTGGNDNDYYFYKMTTKNNTNPGFYWANNDGSRFKMPNNSNKAYLALPKSTAQNVRGFLLDFIKTPTSINQIPSPNTKHPSPDGDVFDLTGRRFSTTQSLPKGIYISNGKKFVVK